MNEYTNEQEAVLDTLNETKDLLNKVIAKYAEKASKNDFWYYWYVNAKNHYIRKARKVKAQIEEIEALIEADKLVLDAQNKEIADAEAQRRTSEEPKAEQALVSCGDANNSCQGSTPCSSEGPCKRADVVQEFGGIAHEVASISSTENQGTPT